MIVVEDTTFKQVVVGLQCLHHIARRHSIMCYVVAMLIGNKEVDYCAFEENYQGLSYSFGKKI